MAGHLLYGLATAALVTSTMRFIGSTHGMHGNLARLVVDRSMQPWVSLLWAAASILVVVFAARTKARELWMGGGVAVIVLLVKMLMIDLSTFSLVAKVSVFLVMGVAFIALGAFCPLPPDEKDADSRTNAR